MCGLYKNMMHARGYKKLAFIVGVDRKSSPKLCLSGRKYFALKPVTETRNMPLTSSLTDAHVNEQFHQFTEFFCWL